MRAEVDARRRFLVAEKHQIVREGLRQALHSQHDLQLCAEASNGEEALLGIECHRPDVAVGFVPPALAFRRQIGRAHV